MQLPKFLRNIIREQNPKDDLVIVYKSNGSFGLEVKSVDSCPIVAGQWYRDLFSGGLVKLRDFRDGKVLVEGREYGIDAKVFKMFFRLEGKDEK